MSAHRIKKQTLEVTHDAQEVSFFLQQELGRLYRSQLTPVIESVFNEFDPSAQNATNETIAIERLDLDLGDIDKRNLDAEFVRKTMIKLREALHEMIEKNDPAEIERKSPDERSLNILRHYFEHGSLPWWGTESDIHSLLQDQIARQPDELEALFNELLNENPDTRQRIHFLFQNGDAKIANMIARIEAGEATNELDQQNDTAPLYEPHAQSNELTEAWSQLIEKLRQDQLTPEQNRAAHGELNQLIQKNRSAAGDMLLKLINRKESALLLRLIALLDDAQLIQWLTEIPALKAAPDAYQMLLEQHSIVAPPSQTLRLKIWPVLLGLLLDSTNNQAAEPTTQSIVTTCSRELHLLPSESAEHGGEEKARPDHELDQQNDTTSAHVSQSQSNELTEAWSQLIEKLRPDELTSKQKRAAHDELNRLIQQNRSAASDMLLKLINRKESATLERIIALLDDAQLIQWLTEIPALKAAPDAYRMLLKQNSIAAPPSQALRLKIWPVLLRLLFDSTSNQAAEPTTQSIVTTCARELQLLPPESAEHGGEATHELDQQNDTAPLYEPHAQSKEQTETWAHLIEKLRQDQLTPEQNIAAHDELNQLIKKNMAAASDMLLQLINRKESATLERIIALLDDAQLIQWLTEIPALKAAPDAYQMLLKQHSIAAPPSQALRLKIWPVLLGLLLDSTNNQAAEPTTQSIVTTCARALQLLPPESAGDTTRSDHLDYSEKRENEREEKVRATNELDQQNRATPSYESHAQSNELTEAWAHLLEKLQADQLTPEQNIAAHDELNRLIKKNMAAAGDMLLQLINRKESALLERIIALLDDAQLIQWLTEITALKDAPDAYQMLLKQNSIAAPPSQTLRLKIWPVLLGLLLDSTNNQAAEPTTQSIVTTCARALQLLPSESAGHIALSDQSDHGENSDHGREEKGRPAHELDQQNDTAPLYEPHAQSNELTEAWSQLIEKPRQDQLTPEQHIAAHDELNRLIQQNRAAAGDMLLKLINRKESATLERIIALLNDAQLIQWLTEISALKAAPDAYQMLLEQHSIAAPPSQNVRLKIWPVLLGLLLDSTNNQAAEPTTQSIVTTCARELHLLPPESAEHGGEEKARPDHELDQQNDTAPYHVSHAQSNELTEAWAHLLEKLQADQLTPEQNIAAHDELNRLIKKNMAAAGDMLLQLINRKESALLLRLIALLDDAQLIQWLTEIPALKDAPAAYQMLLKQHSIVAPPSQALRLKIWPVLLGLLLDSRNNQASEPTKQSIVTTCARELQLLPPESAEHGGEEKARPFHELDQQNDTAPLYEPHAQSKEQTEAWSQLIEKPRPDELTSEQKRAALHELNRLIQQNMAAAGDMLLKLINRKESATLERIIALLDDAQLIQWLTEIPALKAAPDAYRMLLKQNSIAAPPSQALRLKIWPVLLRLLLDSTNNQAAEHTTQSIVTTCARALHLLPPESADHIARSDQLDHGEKREHDREKKARPFHELDQQNEPTSAHVSQAQSKEQTEAWAQLIEKLRQDQLTPEQNIAAHGEFNQLIKKNMAAASDMLLKLINRKESALLERIIALLDDAQLIQWIAEIPALTAAPAAYRMLLKQNSIAAPPSQALRLKIWPVLLRLLFDSRNNQAAEPTTQSIVTTCARALQLLPSESAEHGGEEKVRATNELDQQNDTAPLYEPHAQSNELTEAWAQLIEKPRQDQLTPEQNIAAHDELNRLIQQNRAAASDMLLQLINRKESATLERIIALLDDAQLIQWLAEIPALKAAPDAYHLLLKQHSIAAPPSQNVRLKIWPVLLRLLLDSTNNQAAEPTTQSIVTTCARELQLLPSESAEHIALSDQLDHDEKREHDREKKARPFHGLDQQNEPTSAHVSQAQSKEQTETWAQLIEKPQQDQLTPEQNIAAHDELNQLIKKNMAAASDMLLKLINRKESATLLRLIALLDDAQLIQWLTEIPALKAAPDAYRMLLKQNSIAAPPSQALRLKIWPVLLRLLLDSTNNQAAEPTTQSIVTTCARALQPLPPESADHDGEATHELDQQNDTTSAHVSQAQSNELTEAWAQLIEKPRQDHLTPEQNIAAHGEFNQLIKKNRSAAGDMLLKLNNRKESALLLRLIALLDDAQLIQWLTEIPALKAAPDAYQMLLKQHSIVAPPSQALRLKIWPVLLGLLLDSTNNQAAEHTTQSIVTTCARALQLLPPESAGHAGEATHELVQQNEPTSAHVSHAQSKEQTEAWAHLLEKLQADQLTPEQNIAAHDELNRLIKKNMAAASDMLLKLINRKESALLERIIALLDDAQLIQWLAEIPALKGAPDAYQMLLKQNSIAAPPSQALRLKIWPVLLGLLFDSRNNQAAEHTTQSIVTTCSRTLQLLPSESADHIALSDQLDHGEKREHDREKKARPDHELDQQNEPTSAHVSQAQSNELTEAWAHLLEKLRQDQLTPEQNIAAHDELNRLIQKNRSAAGDMLLRLIALLDDAQLIQWLTEIPALKAAPDAYYLLLEQHSITAPPSQALRLKIWPVLLGLFFDSRNNQAAEPTTQSIVTDCARALQLLPPESAEHIALSDQLDHGEKREHDREKKARPFHGLDQQNEPTSAHVSQAQSKEQTETWAQLIEKLRPDELTPEQNIAAHDELNQLIQKNRAAASDMLLKLINRKESALLLRLVALLDDAQLIQWLTEIPALKAAPDAYQMLLEQNSITAPSSQNVRLKIWPVLLRLLLDSTNNQAAEPTTQSIVTTCARELQLLPSESAGDTTRSDHLDYSEKRENEREEKVRATNELDQQNRATPSYESHAQSKDMTEAWAHFIEKLRRDELTQEKKRETHDALKQLIQQKGSAAGDMLLQLIKKKESALLLRLIALFDDEQLTQWLSEIPALKAAPDAYQLLLKQHFIAASPSQEFRLKIWSVLFRLVLDSAHNQASESTTQSIVTDCARALHLRPPESNEHTPSYELQEADKELTKAWAHILEKLRQDKLATEQQRVVYDELNRLIQKNRSAADSMLLNLIKNKEPVPLLRLVVLLNDAELIQWFAEIPALKNVPDVYQMFLEEHSIAAPPSLDVRLKIWPVLLGLVFDSANNQTAEPATQSIVTACARALQLLPSESKRRIVRNDHPTRGVDIARGDTLSHSQDLSTDNVVAVRSDSHRDGTEYYIQNSGVIILCPFLPQFFKRLEISSGEKITNRNDALLMLHYLVHSEKPRSEHELTLNKFLCGVDFSEAVDFTQAPNDEQQAAIDELLGAVIAHWPGLSQVSPEWLRQVFLRRAGALRKRNGQWILEVERAVQDVILKKLPWTISTVKLPWMETILNVEWKI